MTAPQLLVLTALAVAVAGQGGYYLGPRVVVTVLLAAALALFARAGRGLWLRCGLVPVTLAALAGWAFVSSFVARSVGAALPTAATLLGAAVVVVIVGQAARRQRDQLVLGALAIGGVAALSGWLGVVFGLSRWASPGSGLWRATTTITYSNAAAALMGCLVLVVLARLVARGDVDPASVSRGRVGEPVAAVLLVVGLGVTLSRAGIVGVGVGYLALVALLGFRRVVRATRRPLAGAAVALASLVPSLSSHSPARESLALVGLGLALVIAATRFGFPRPKRLSRARVATPARLLLAVLGVALAIGVVVFGVSWGSAHWASLRERVALSSPSRSAERRAALTLIDHHLVTGVGPGHATFLWETPDHHLRTDRYAHNEYLQLAAEDGMVGLLFLGLIAAEVIRTVRAGRPRRSGRDHPAYAEWTGCVVALGYFAIHSGLDFLWHVPVVPLVAALLVGLAGPHPHGQARAPSNPYRQENA